MKILWRWLVRGCWLLGIAALVVSITGAGWTLYSRAGDGPAMSGSTSPAPPPEKGLVCVVLGNVDVKHGLRSLAPTQSGRVEKVFVEEDQKVEGGKVLLSLDKEPTNLLIQQAKAEVEAAKVRCDQARKLVEQQKVHESLQSQSIEAAAERVKAAEAILKRAQEQHKIDGNKAGHDLEVLQAKIQEAKAGLRGEKLKLQELQLNDPQHEIRQAQAALAAAEARLRQAEHALKECDLVAPGPGMVVRIQTGKGDLLSPQRHPPAILFCPDEPRIIRAELDQESAPKVRKGQKVFIEDEIRSGARWEGRVDRIPDSYLQRRSNVPEPFAFNENRILECIITIDATPGKELPRLGQRVRVRIVEEGTR
jgi:membrane fusion protein (multidrug efflux system)